MRLMQRAIIAAVAILTALVSAGPATAHGYNGNGIGMFEPAYSYNGTWPVTVSHSQFSNGTGCLTLNGTAKGGQATLVMGGTKYPYGQFVIVKGILVANIVEPLYGQNGSLMFIANASRGHIGDGLYEDLRGGSNFDFGDLAFGTKNGSC